MQYSIDSILENIAALVGDDGTVLHFAADLLPANAKPGDILQQQPDGSFLPQPQASALRRSRAFALFRKLKRQNTL